MATTTTTVTTTCNCGATGGGSSRPVALAAGGGDMGQGPRPKIAVQVTYHDLVEGVSKTGPAGAVAKLCLGQLYLEAAENVDDEAIAATLATAGNNLLRGSTSGLPSG